MYIASPHAIRLVWSEILFPNSTLQILQKLNCWGQGYLRTTLEIKTHIQISVLLIPEKICIASDWSGYDPHP